MRFIQALLLIIIAIIVLGVAFIYSGTYNIGADVPHSTLVYRLMATLRDRSIDTHARGVSVPPLDDPKLLAEGADHYGEMCTGCHLAPGMSDTEIRQGLYPKPPNLSKPNDASPAQMFWVIKHGMKMSAMPAWGKTHSDDMIWAMVAFVRKLPTLTPEQFHEMTSAGGGDHEHMHMHMDAPAPTEPGAPEQPHDDHPHGDAGT